MHIPSSLPSSPVFTLRGWMHFDKWGRERKVKPQPELEEGQSVTLHRLCSYRDLRKTFLFLPPCPMLTDAARKKKMVDIKEKMRTFFLPHKEKRKAEMTLAVAKLVEKRAKKRTKKQRQAEIESNAAFRAAFLGGGPSDSLPPGPGTDESASDTEQEFME